MLALSESLSKCSLFLFSILVNISVSYLRFSSISRSFWYCFFISSLSFSSPSQIAYTGSFIIDFFLIFSACAYFGISGIWLAMIGSESTSSAAFGKFALSMKYFDFTIVISFFVYISFFKASSSTYSSDNSVSSASRCCLASWASCSNFQFNSLKSSRALIVLASSWGINLLSFSILNKVSII